MAQATLRKFLSISVLFHGGLFGLLLLLGLYSPSFSDRPLRVRLIEPPGAPGLPAPAPPTSSEPGTRPVPPAKAEKTPGRMPPLPTPPRSREVERPAPPARPPEQRSTSPEKAEAPPPAAPPAVKPPAAPPAVKVDEPPSGTSEPTKESRVPGTESRETKVPPVTPAESAPATKPPPQVASLPTLPPVELPRSAAPEAPREVSRPAGPEATRVLPPAAPPRAGLSLGGASQELGPPPAPGPAAGSSARPARPSLRDQIASLGSGEWAEGQGSAKQTIDLDNREPIFVDYLALLKRRIERVWGYPPEAANSGISGDLLLIFTLNKSGTLIDLRLIRSSGFPVLDEAAIRAVKLAAPYDPFPTYMGTDPWNIRASFTYYLPYGFRRR